MKNAVIGLDCSTTAAKAIVWSTNGKVLSQGKSNLELKTPFPGWAEQKADSWWVASSKAIKQAINESGSSEVIKAISISHQRESFVPVDHKLQPLCNGILWLDSRAINEIKDIDRKIGKQKIHSLTGKIPDLATSVYKILWLKKNRPAIFEKTWKFLDVHAYLIWKLTGNIVTSFPSANPFGLLDMKKLKWSEEIMNKLGLKSSQFPDLCEPGQIVGTVIKDAARITGLRADTLVIAGGGDGQAACLGANVVKQNKASLNLGTAVVAGVVYDKYVFDKRFQTLCSCQPGKYIAETVIRSGTQIINWFIEKFYDGKDTQKKLSTLEQEAKSLRPGSNGLVTLPYWDGVSMSYWDPEARGVTIGWSHEHGRAHLFRSIMEGIAFEQRLLFEGVESALKTKIKEIIITGGGSRNSLWCQIIADITNNPVVKIQTEELSSLGAGIMAAYAAKFYGNLADAASGMSHIKKKFVPDKSNKQKYDKIYRNIYKPLFPCIQKIRNNI